MPASEAEVSIPAGTYTLQGSLSVPPHAVGLVLFAHGSGSSRFSPRNRFVAKEMNKTGLATLLFDLLTPEEEEIDLTTREHRFNIELLAHRLIYATEWVRQNMELRHFNIGYFGSSTGAAAALVAAARHPTQVQAIVSRGGRPDLAGDDLINVQAPTLLIVGGNDFGVIELNEDALQGLSCSKELLIIDGATHLFEEPGKLEEVAVAAASWFQKHLHPADNLS
jgi:pimeloyl-ACP methyl ester carboxylesterase